MFELRVLNGLHQGAALPLIGEQWLIGAHLAPPRYIASQGTALGRAGRVHVEQDGDTIWVDRAPVVYIYGEVQRPGVQALPRDMTVLQSLATAGGLTLRGTERGIRVHRRDESGEIKIIQPGMNDKLLPNDVIYVKESLF